MIRLVTILIIFSQPFIAFAQGERYEEEGYLSKALEAYRKEKNLVGVASINTAMGRYDSVLIWLQRGKATDSSAQSLVINYQVEAKYWQSQNKYDLALASLQRAKDLAEELDDTTNRAIILSSIGSIYFSHQPDKSVAHKYFLESNALCDSAVHYNIIARNYGRLANTAMAANDGATAKMYLDRAYKIVQLSGNLPVKAYIISSLAIFTSDTDLRQSIRYLKQAISIKRELNQVRSLQNDLLNISEAYMGIKDYKKAEASLAEVGEIATSLRDNVYLKYYYERATMLDSLRGDFKGALRNYTKAMAFKDNTFSAQRLRDVREIQEKYETEQREKTIAEKELEIEHQKYRQALILGASLVSVLILVVVLIVVRSRNKKQQNYLRLQTIVKTQEEVQQRIARDLHDGLVQALGAAKMSLQSIGPDSDKSALQKQIQTASDIIDEAVTEARSISHQVLPYSLLKDGLVSALDDLFTRSLTSFEFDHDETINPGEHTSINIYRIAQELVNNVRNHAESAHITASLKVVNQHLRFTFSDSGKGFDIGSVTKGAGLSNMTTRTELIGGTIAIRSTPGKGTSTDVNVPV